MERNKRIIILLVKCFTLLIGIVFFSNYETVIVRVQQKPKAPKGLASWGPQGICVAASRAGSDQPVLVPLPPSREQGIYNELIAFKCLCWEEFDSCCGDRLGAGFLFSLEAQLFLFIINSWNHRNRMVWAGRDIKDHLLPIPLP